MAHLLPAEYLKNGGPGRPPGIPSTKQVGYSHRDFIAALRRNDMDPVTEMCALYRDPATPARTKFEILKDLMSYAYSKRKQVEVKGEVEHRNLNVSWNIDGPSPIVPTSSVQIGDEPPE